MKHQELLQQLRNTFQDNAIFSELINATEPILTWYDEHQDINFSELNEKEKNLLLIKWQEKDGLVKIILEKFTALISQAVKKEDFAADDLLPCYETELGALELDFQKLYQLNQSVVTLCNVITEVNQQLAYLDCNVNEADYYVTSLRTVSGFIFEPFFIKKLLNDIKAAATNPSVLTSSLEEIKKALLKSDNDAIAFLAGKVLTQLSDQELEIVLRNANDQNLLKSIVDEIAISLSLAQPGKSIEQLKLLANLHFALGKESNLYMAAVKELDVLRVKEIFKELGDFFSNVDYSELSSEEQNRYVQLQDALIKFEIGKTHAGDLRKAGFNSATIEQQLAVELALNKLVKNIEINTISRELVLEDLNEIYVTISEFIKSSKYNMLFLADQTRLNNLQDMVSSRILEIIAEQLADQSKVSSLLPVISMLYSNGLDFSRILGELPAPEIINSFLEKLEQEPKPYTHFQAQLHHWLKSHTPSHKLAAERATLKNGVLTSLVEGVPTIDQESYSQYRRAVDELARHQKGSSLYKIFETRLSNKVEDLYAVQPIYIKQFTAYDVHDYLHFSAISPRIKLKDSSKEIINRVLRKQLYLRDDEVNTFVTRNLEEGNLATTKDMIKLAKAKKFNLSNKNVVDITKHSIGNDKQLAASILNRSLWNRLTGGTVLNDRLKGNELHEILLEIQSNLKTNPSDEGLNKLAKTILAKSSYRNKLSKFYNAPDGKMALEKLDNIYIKELLKAKRGLIFDTKDALSSLYHERIEMPHTNGSQNTSTASIEKIENIEVTPEQRRKEELAQYIFEKTNVAIMSIGDKNVSSLSDDDQDALKDLVADLMRFAESEKLMDLKSTFPVIDKITVQLVAEKAIKTGVQVGQHANEQAVLSDQKSASIEQAGEPDHRTELTVH